MDLPQKTRLVILALYAALLVSVCRFLFGTWLPPNAEKGLWLYASFAHLLLGTLLLSPHFTKPVNAVSDAVIAALLLLEAHGAVSAVGAEWARYLWRLVFAYYVAVVVVGSLAITVREPRSTGNKQLTRSLYLLSTRLGETSLVFSLLYFFALAAFHLDSRRELVTLGATWVVIVPFRLLEQVTLTGKHLWEVWSHPFSLDIPGEPCARKEPGLILLRRTADEPVHFGQVLTMKRSPRDALHHAMAIGEFQLAEECWIRCLEIAGQFASETETKLRSVALGSPVFRLDSVTDQATIDSAFQQSRAYSDRADLIGLVAPNTDIGALRFEVTRTDVAIGEGQLVEVAIGDRRVLYQLINGITQEDVLAQKNTYGFARGSAKKIGKWDDANSRFEHVRWIPQLNEPVFLQQAQASPDDATAVGFFPGTRFPVRANVQNLVTHNTAILGILGVGKTFLALELVERMILAGIKVIALDLTNQYATELAPYFDANTEAPKLDKLKATGPPGKAKCRQNVAEGGSVQTFQAELKSQLAAFMADPQGKVQIYNPAAFEVWKQDSKLYQGQASMAQLTPTEVTRVITETALELCSATITDQAKVCIVYEEAHSLIPEWNAVASEGDKAATNGTAKAILQGRKYGLGCLVVTQRTANVTKTILNQCNTVFALRVFDATGMEFLRNYVGDDYSSVLSTLEDRHAVVFGRGSSCSDPVLVRLNDRDKFLRLNRPKP